MIYRGIRKQKEKQKVSGGAINADATSADDAAALLADHQSLHTISTSSSVISFATIPDEDNDSITSKEEDEKNFVDNIIITQSMIRSRSPTNLDSSRQRLFGYEDEDGYFDYSNNINPLREKLTTPRISPTREYNRTGSSSTEESIIRGYFDPITEDDQEEHFNNSSKRAIRFGPTTTISHKKATTSVS